jgi:hypothetical protein
MNMSLQPAPWLHRLAFVAGNLAMGAAVTIAVLLPVRDYLAERDQQIAEQGATLARFKAVAGREAAVQAAAGKLATDRDPFLVGKSEGVIGADLQTRLKGMAEAAGAKVRSVRSLPAQGDEQTRYVGSRIEVFGPLAAIHRAVHAIENAKPYLLIKGAAIRLSPPIGQTGIRKEPIIEAQLDVFGAVQIEAAEK